MNVDSNEYCDLCSLKAKNLVLKNIQSYDATKNLLKKWQKMVYICVWARAQKVIIISISFETSVVSMIRVEWVNYLNEELKTYNLTSWFESMIWVREISNSNHADSWITNFWMKPLIKPVFSLIRIKLTCDSSHSCLWFESHW